jgi:hypothetical protein
MLFMGASFYNDTGSMLAHRNKPVVAVRSVYDMLLTEYCLLFKSLGEAPSFTTKSAALVERGRNSQPALKLAVPSPHQPGQQPVPHIFQKLNTTFGNGQINVGSRDDS